MKIIKEGGWHRMGARSPRPGWLALDEGGLRPAVDGDRLITITYNNVPHALSRCPE